MTTAQQNIAWVAQHFKWKTAVENWKNTVEKACNVSNADEYWRNAFTCPDVSGVTCQNGDASQVVVDSMNCQMTVCSDGLYSDQMAFLDMWQHNLKSHETMMSIHANQLVDCVCAERKCMDSDSITLEAWNSQSLKYSELALALLDAKGEIEQLQKKSEDWTALNEKYAAVLEASQLIENLQNQSQAWEAQSQTLTALKTDLMAANEKINKLESQSAVWDAQGETYSTLSSEMLDTKEKIKQLQNSSEEWNMQSQKYSDLSNAMSKVNEQIQTIETKNEEYSTIGAATNPASSCDAIKSSNPAAEDGLYYLKDLEGNVYQTFCSMNIAGGGWTLVASVHENNIKGRCTTGDRWSSEQGNSADKPHGDGFWENRATHGEATSATSDDYKNSGYFAMNARDIMIWQVPNDMPMESYASGAFLKFHTTSGFLASHGGNLGYLFSVDYNMRKGQYTTNVDNGPAIPITWDTGSNEEILGMFGEEAKAELEAGYVQFRAINHEGDAYALCPGVKIKPGMGNAEHPCLGSTGTLDRKYCGDFAAKDWESTPSWRLDQRMIDSVVMIFYK